MKSSIPSVINWLLEGDETIQYQTYRDLLNAPLEILSEMQNNITIKGWGKGLLEKQDPLTGLWGKGIYSPKWISTHYTLLELKNMGVNPTHPQYVEGSNTLLNNMWINQGKVRKDRYQDLCVSAMILSICSYAQIRSPKINEIVDYILDNQYLDSGWNCRWEKGDKHSSLHTTLSVLEAFRDYEINAYNYRLIEIRERIPKAWEFILKKNLFKSVQSGEIINTSMLMISYPCRWKYDILRCMDYFASIEKCFDNRMEEALSIIIQKKRKSNHWPVQHKHPGIVHFIMENTGDDSRCNTLRVLRVLRVYKPEMYKEFISGNMK